MKSRFVYLIVFLFVSCNASETTKEKSAEFNQDTSEIVLDSTQTIEQNKFAEGLELFTNMEWVSYCLPLPLDEYPESFDEESEKGKHVFVQKGNKKSEIVVTGMMRSDETVLLDDYFKNSYTEEDEGQGKIITSKSIMPGKNGFYAKGYWNNLIYDERFFEIVWFRKQEVVKLEVNYALQDSTKWNTWFESMLESKSECAE